ncbi:SDR family oxidoreductase [Prescottella equi]|uniref:SDR family oxidoreductase n=1 Tax=Rhodococcus hoagii TaxID=43767 RepID=UPI0009BE27D9|nr:SDR family oxidoreductase [Prescottella equi]OQQ38361.1 short-chain dehydrogenase [Prescottella equi]
MIDIGNVLISGGASGLGAATATAVAKAGGTPLVLDMAVPDAEHAYRLVDIADSSAVAEATAELAGSVGGRLDGVFTAAGIDCCGRLDEVAAPDWERVIAVDLMGTAAVVRAALPYLASPSGRIVTCASTLGLKAVSDATAYCAAKFGVVGFTRGLAAETAGRYGVTLLVPGGMDTSFFDGRTAQYRPPPDAHLNRPEDVAATVVYALGQPEGCEIREMVVCASEESSWP